MARRNQVPTCCRSKQTDESRSFQVAPQAYRILSVHPGVKDQIAEIDDFDTTSLKACQSAALICISMKQHITLTSDQRWAEACDGSFAAGIQTFIITSALTDSSSHLKQDRTRQLETNLRHVFAFILKRYS